MAKIAHLADIHYCPKHLKWVDRAMRAAVDNIANKPIDAWVIAGDSFEHGLGAHEPAFHAYLEQVARLGGHAHGLILQGTLSHDRPGTLNALKQLGTRYPLLIADRPEAWALGDFGWAKWSEIRTDIDIDRGDIKAIFCVLPSLNLADPEVSAKGPREWVKGWMARFREFAKEARELGISSILVTHGLISGCHTESNHAMVSPDHEFDTETLFSSGCDAIMVGHIHKYQEWTTGDQTIAYSSSLARLVHGDNNPHGWLMWDVDVTPGRPVFAFIESPTRQLLEIEFPGPPDMGKLQELAAEAQQDDAVRIRWTVDKEYAALIDKPAIRAMFAHCETIAIEPTVLDVQSVRSAGISRAATLEEKLGRFLDTTGDRGSLDALVARLQLLQHKAPEEIVKGILEEPK